MPRRKIKKPEDYDRALRRGFGRGSGSQYKPFIRVQDVSSKGRSSKIPGLTVEREHHYLSDNETRLHYFLEREPTITDIREQFPLLPLQLAQDIAEEVGIPYPRIPRTRTPSILTVDALVTHKVGTQERYAAFAVKLSADLRSRRVNELLELQRLFCEIIGIPWKVVTELQLNDTVAKNLEWASAPLRGPLGNELTQWINEGRYVGALPDLDTGQQPLPIVVAQISNALQIDEDFAQSLLRGLVWKRIIDVDLSISIIKSRALHITNIHADRATGDEVHGIAG